MKRSNILLISVFVFLTITQAFSITRPPAPAAVSAVDYDYTNDNIKVTVSPPVTPPAVSEWDNVKYHIVLLTDLSFSLQRSLREGKGTIGPVLSVEKTPADVNTGPVSINLGNAAYSGRYFTAACLSAVDKKPGNPNRVYSSWVLYRNPTSGVPLSVSITKPSKEETPYYRCLSISPTEAMCFLQFSLDNASGNSLTLKNRTTDILTIPNLGSITGTPTLLFEDSLKHAVNSLVTASAYNSILLQCDKQFSLFFRYTIGASDSIGFRILTSATNKVKYEGMFFTVDDVGYMDMIKTVVALQKVPKDSLNPITFKTTPATIPESTSRLFCAAILHLSLAHNSPDANNNEASQSLHNNYIQAMDRFVRGWGGTNGLGTRTSWPDRLKAMHDTILAMNVESIIDPVIARNEGTIAEFGQDVQKRKNYAFYEGYSRLGCDIERPSGYTRTSPVGAGIVLRISKNVSLYSANLADTFNMFDSAIINGALNEQRIVLAANDSLIDKINTDGLWVQGDSIAKGEQPYYTGVSAVRLPLQSVLPHIAIDSGFSFSPEQKGIEDAQGTVMGGPENSIFGIQIIDSSGKSVDTIANDVNANILLHGNKRKLVYNKEYKEPANSIQFIVQGASNDVKKILVPPPPHGYSTVIEDTSTLADGGKTGASEIMQPLGTTTKIIVRYFEKIFHVFRLGIQDIKNNRLRIIAKNRAPIPISKTQEVPGKFITKYGSQGKFYLAGENVEVKDQLGNLIYPLGSETTRILTSTEYNTNILSNNYITMSLKKGAIGNFEIIFKFDGVSSVFLKERIDYIGIIPRDITFKQQYGSNTDANLPFEKLANFNGKLPINVDIYFEDGPTKEEVKKNLDEVSISVMGGNGSSYPVELVTPRMVFYKDGASTDPTVGFETPRNVKMQFKFMPNFTIPDAASLIDASKYSVDVFIDKKEGQNSKDAEEFDRKSGYQYGKSRNERDDMVWIGDPNECISPVTYKFGNGDLSHRYIYSAGIVYLTAFINNEEWKRNRITYPYQAKWVLLSGHGFSSRKAGFYKGTDAIFLSTTDRDYEENIITKELFIKYWKNVEVAILNSCYNTNVNLITNKDPYDPINNIAIWDDGTGDLLSNDGRKNNGLKWFEIIEKRGAILGWGKCIVDGTSFGAVGGKGTSPTDRDGKTDVMMKKFLSRIQTDSDLARSWVKAAWDVIKNDLDAGVDIKKTSIRYNAVGIEKIGTKIYIYAMNPKDNAQINTPVWQYP